MGSKVNIIRIGHDASAEKGKDKLLNLQESQITLVDKKEQQLVNKVDQITNSLSRPYFRNILKKLALNHEKNAGIICKFIIAEQTELNIKDSTREGKIKVLVWLSNHFQDKKSFKEMTKQDILEHLNSLRKPSDIDATHKWIGTYNGRQIILSKFFKWLYNPNEPDHGKRITPPCMRGLKRLPRKERTTYRPTDIWESREHAIFLRYCPSKRDRCYHAIANDMSARPHEILNLKIKDIKFNLTEGGIQYAEVRINGGKTGSRTIPLIDSMPYLKEWLQEHPSGSNIESRLFVSLGNNHGAKLTYDALSSHYNYYKKRYFPPLLEEKTVPESDKSFMRNMLTKPWNLYIFRHSALTETSQILKESVLRDHAGWTMSSKMPQIYIHYYGNESSKSILEARGIIRKEEIDKKAALRTRQCPNCNEPNKPDSKFCVKCRMVLSYDAYTEAVEQSTNQYADIFDELRTRMATLENKFNK